MKNLTLPTKNKDTIDISLINPNFKGIVIAYNKDYPVQYIAASDGYWYSSNTIDDTVASNCNNGDNILEVCNSLLNSKLATHFKVIEFK